MNENLHKKFEIFLKDPTDNGYKDLVTDLEEYKRIPPCPRCQSNDVVRDGTHPRKTGRVQQYWCKKCSHSYTKMSIESKKRREKYPHCPTCKRHLTKNGYVRWTTKDDTKKKLPKYYCRNCDSFFYFKKTEN